jgi:chromosome segregation ATPase
MTTLRNQINTLKEKLEKKKEEILDYKSKCEGNDYTNLENDLLSNYDKIKELKYKNAEMIANLEDFLENYFLQREENFQLKNKLKDFIDTFNTYKENTERNNLDLEKKLKYLEEKNIECIIYHNNKIKNLSKCVEDNKSKLTEAGNLIEKINEEIEEINKDIKSKNNNINQHQNETEILNNKKKELEKNKKKNEENINKMNIQRDESNKINKERVKNKINLKNRYKEIKLKYKNIINKVDEINELINKKDKEINDLKKEIEEIKISRNLFQ